ncbi:MAG: hypothetical protein ABIR37_00315 [Candidatus Saccharimonadales bacterium]
MQIVKKSLLVGAGVATIGLAGLSGAGIASAATTTSTTGNGSLVDKISSTFHLDKSKVQAVFDADRQSHKADMEAKRTAALKQAVTDNKLTQAQADHITAAWKEIDALRGTTKPDDMSSTTRDQIKQKMTDLRDWLKAQNIDLRSIDGLGGRGHGHGFGGPGMGKDDSESSSSSSSTSTN